MISRFAGLFNAVLLLTCIAAPAVAQQPDSVQTPAERIRARLRAIAPLIRDTTRQDSLAADSAAADSLDTPRVEFVDSIPTGARSEGLTGVARDSVTEQLLRLVGYVPTEYKAEQARFAADSARLDLRRAAEVVREGVRLTADTSIVFYQDSAYACAYGKPVVSGSGLGAPVSSDSLCYDIDRSIGIARGARTQVDQGGTWYVTGDELVTVGEDVFTHDAIFTDCQDESPHYHFGAANMKVVRDNVLVARDVTLRFADVPVLWLPFFVQSLARGRRSGLLTPRFSINDVAPTSNRYARQIDNLGFYWAISDHLGAETAFGWRSDDFTKLRGRLEYRYNRQFLNGSFDFSHFWQAEGGTNFTLRTSNSWKPDERTDMRLSGDYASNTRFVEQRTLDPRELTQTIGATAGVSRRFGWGSVQIDATRRQYLSDSKTQASYPSIGVNLSPITLFEALPGEESWYSNATWSGNVNMSVDRNLIDDAREASPTVQESQTARGRVSSSFSLGSFSWSQSFDYNDDTRHLRDVFPDSSSGQAVPDTLVLPGSAVRTMSWSTGLNYQQRLIGSTTFTPGVSIRGSMLRNDSTGGATISSPTRLDFNAALRTDLFGFWPGVGPVERLRHKLSPGFTYTYSPKPVLNDEQRQFFARDTLAREVSRLTISVTQTFEAKMRQSAEDTLTEEAAADTIAADTATGPRRRDTVRPITLLSINTDALVYDFVAAREGRGIQTMEIGNNLQSDLFRGLQISFSHSLFRPLQADTTIGQDPLNPPREFDLHLSRVSASFSLNSDSWIFRALGLGRGDDEPEPAAQQQQQDTLSDMSPDAAVDRSGAGLGLLGGGSRQPQQQQPATPVGTWNASFSYSLSRPRTREAFTQDNQMLTANVSLQPTVNWGLQWNTGYSFTDGEFTDHIFTLTRRMHDWDAYFDFIKAQNGNFSFQFRVNLRANPDVKLDYEQRDLQGLPGGIR